MGFLDRFRSKRRDPSPTLVVSAPRRQWQPQDPRFVVLDLETTGLSASNHRIVELAMITTDPYGTVLDEWTTRINPEGPVGATHIHGITDADVSSAPRFREILSEVSGRLNGAAVAAHNARFDLAFLRAEYARASWQLPFVHALCTLEASGHHLPHLDRRRLVDCCSAIGYPVTHAHSALGDAQATAVLLAAYMDQRRGQPPRQCDMALPGQALQVVWPTGPSAGPVPVAQSQSRRVSDRALRNISATTKPSQTLVQLVGRFSLNSALEEGAPTGALAYLEKLAEVLEDGVLTEAEANDLAEVATTQDLSEEQVAAANRAFVLALAHAALDDGKVSRDEKTELLSVAGLLGLEARLIPELLDRAEVARATRLSANLGSLPDPWEHGEPLRVGDKVVFTGCEGSNRDALEQRSEALGVRVMNKVTSKTALLVADGTMAGGKLADATALNTRIVSPATYAALLQHLQPAEARASLQTATRSAVKSSALTGSTGPDPSLVREWARANGWEVGVRGRLPAPVLTAYAAAHPPLDTPV